MARRPRPARALRTAALTAAALVVAGAAPTAAQNPSGFDTSVRAMLKPGADAPAGVVIDPLISVGDSLKSGFTFDALPDGISFEARGNGRVDLFVNHETSLVPFPVTPLKFTDYTNAHVDRLTLAAKGGILGGEDVIPSDANYQRFCSNFLATEAQGFDRDILFTNEEATDVVNRTGLAWPATSANGSNPEQAGVVVALDVKSGEYRTLYGMGRHNHENSVAIPGYDDLVLLSGDDTFSAPSSQLYSYVADDTDALWADQGSLFAFVSANPAVNDYGDLTGSQSVNGWFIPVPREIAIGNQTALENWSNANNVFQFIRVEDIAYDRNDPNVVYLADTGEPRADTSTSAGTGRLSRAAATIPGTNPPRPFEGPFPNGRIFRLVLDERNPLEVDSLSILIDADAGGYRNPAVIHQPDNLETTDRYLFIQEDPGGHNQFNLGAGPGARVWRYDLVTGDLDAVLEVDQTLDEDATAGYDKDESTTKARAGAWESSGIIDASSIWGEGWFLLDVQAGSAIVEWKDGTLGTENVRFEREGGQLLRVYIPSS